MDDACRWRRVARIRFEEDGGIDRHIGHDTKARARRVEAPAIALNRHRVLDLTNRASSALANHISCELKLALRISEQCFNAAVVARQGEAKLARQQVTIGHYNLDRPRCLPMSDDCRQQEAHQDRATATPIFQTK